MDFNSYKGRERVRPVNHGFTGTEQSEYDSLSAKGRTAYDMLRWYDNASHKDAYTRAKAEYGTNADRAAELQALFDAARGDS